MENIMSKEYTEEDYNIDKNLNKIASECLYQIDEADKIFNKDYCIAALSGEGTYPTLITAKDLVLLSETILEITTKSMNKYNENKTSL